MRIVFMGTPRFAAHILENLCDQHEVVAVYTRPDAVSGRGKKLIPSPVKQVALQKNLPVHTPTTLKDEEVFAELAAYEPEAICVAAYGMLLPNNVLELPIHGCLNVHASALPRWRGAAPIERAILAQDEQAGVSIMKIAEKLDAGDYCIIRTTDIADKTAITLTDELADLGATALLSALQMCEAGSIKWTKQDESQVVYAAKMGKGELFIDPEMSVHEAALKVQASSPAHPSRCSIASRPLTVLESRVVTDPAVLEGLRLLRPGRVMFFQKRLFIAFPDGVLEVLAVRPDGKKSMDAKAFAAGVQNIKSGVLTWEAL